jgi:hypothetical protein
MRHDSHETWLTWDITRREKRGQAKHQQSHIGGNGVYAVGTISEHTPELYPHLARLVALNMTHILTSRVRERKHASESEKRRERERHGRKEREREAWKKGERERGLKERRERESHERKVAKSRQARRKKEKRKEETR